MILFVVFFIFLVFCDFSKALLIALDQRKRKKIELGKIHGSVLYHLDSAFAPKAAKNKADFFKAMNQLNLMIEELDGLFERFSELPQELTQTAEAVLEKATKIKNYFDCKKADWTNLQAVDAARVGKAELAINQYHSAASVLVQVVKGVGRASFEEVGQLRARLNALTTDNLTENMKAAIENAKGLLDVAAFETAKSNLTEAVKLAERSRKKLTDTLKQLGQPADAETRAVLSAVSTTSSAATQSLQRIHPAIPASVSELRRLTDDISKAATAAEKRNADIISTVKAEARGALSQAEGAVKEADALLSQIGKKQDKELSDLKNKALKAAKIANFSVDNSTTPVSIDIIQAAAEAAWKAIKNLNHKSAALKAESFKAPSRVPAF